MTKTEIMRTVKLLLDNAEKDENTANDFWERLAEDTKSDDQIAYAHQLVGRAMGYRQASAIILRSIGR